MIIDFNYGAFAQLPTYIGAICYQDYSLYALLSPTPSDRMEIVGAENRYELVIEEDRFPTI